MMVEVVMIRTLQQVSSAAIILTSRRRLLLAPWPPGFNGGSSNQTRIISLTLSCELPEVEDEEYLRAAKMQRDQHSNGPTDCGRTKSDRQSQTAGWQSSVRQDMPTLTVVACWLSSAPQGR